MSVRLWALLVAVVVVATGAALLLADTLANARAADVTQIVREIERLERVEGENTAEHRDRNETLHDAHCRQHEALARAVGASIPPCPAPLGPHEGG